MKLTTVKEIYKNREEYLNREVTVGGWVRSVRGSKAFGFIVLHDGTFFETLQVVYHDNMPNFAEISKLNVGAAIIVRGTLVPTPEAKQPFEIQADEVQVEASMFPTSAPITEYATSATGCAGKTACPSLCRRKAARERIMRCIRKRKPPKQN